MIGPTWLPLTDAGGPDLIDEISAYRADDPGKSPNALFGSSKWRRQCDSAQRKAEKMKIRIFEMLARKNRRQEENR